MWLDRLKELKEQQNLSNKQIAEKMLVSERTINRIFNGENDHPYIDHIDKIAKVLGTTLGDVFAEAKAVVATETVATLQENVDAVTAEKELVVAALLHKIAEHAPAEKTGPGNIPVEIFVLLHEFCSARVAFKQAAEGLVDDLHVSCSRLYRIRQICRSEHHEERNRTLCVGRSYHHHLYIYID